jgi:hypothetical protein
VGRITASKIRLESGHDDACGISGIRVGHQRSTVFYR